MIELRFDTADGPMVIRIEAPVRPPEGVEEWSSIVRTNGRTQTIIGMDPLQALANAVSFTSHYLSGKEGLNPEVAALTGSVPVPPARKAKAKAKC